MAAVVRPLPELKPEIEFFWTSGREGELRFKRCRGCEALVHPPRPICPYCRFREFDTKAVAGQGVVAGFSVNHHQWLPGFEPPYVVAIVAIDDDPRVRVTTNIIGCDPEEVFVGMRVRVVFEQQDDVWFPLFEPTGNPEPGPLPEPERMPPSVRPMARPDKFEDRVTVSGIGMSRLGRRLMVDPLSLTVDACLQAIDDAGLQIEDVDGLSTYPGGEQGPYSEGGIAAVEEALRIRPTWFHGGNETPGQTGSVVAAMLAVAAGLCKHVLCFRTVWHGTHRALTGTVPTTLPSTRIDSDLRLWRVPFGAASAANWIAMQASHHFHRYGTTRESLGWIALNARANAARNPTALYREPMTMDDYLSARMIATPFGLYDCDVPCDGAVAIIISAADTAADLRRPPVQVEAVGTQIIDRVSWDQGVLGHEPQVLGPAAHLWSRTSLRPADVDVAELYDGFTFNCLSWIEVLGFCEIGEGKDFLDGGKQIALDGSLPLNTHGGQLSAGRTHGYGFLHEAVVQLRGDGGARQVEGAEVAVVASGGGTPGGCMLLTRAR
jgi:acetyl-CoA acetyltransferase/uncharacterized OB-fold protein